MEFIRHWPAYTNRGALPVKPLCWDKMFQVAVVFVEMTFNPGTGLLRFYTEIGLNYAGGLLTLPEVKKQ